MKQDMGVITEQEAALLMTATMEHGATLKEIHGITDDMMENVYAYAYQAYKNGQLEEAENLFHFLCLYDLKNPDYFIGLGAVNQVKKNYSKACDFYSLAYVMADNNFNPVFYSGQCQLLMGNIVKALQCFDIVCSRCEDATLVSKANAYMSTIRKNMGEGDELTHSEASEETI